METHKGNEIALKATDVMTQGLTQDLSLMDLLTPSLNPFGMLVNFGALDMGADQTPCSRQSLDSRNPRHPPPFDRRH